MISVIVVNYNGGDSVIARLRALRERTEGEVGEILVVDNGSDDGSPERIREDVGYVRVLPEPENRGYSSGVNRGLAEASGEVLVILNPDACPEPHAVFTLAEAARRHPEFWILGGALVDEAGRVDGCCARPLPELRDIWWEGLFLPKRKERVFSKVVAGAPGVLEVGAVSGAAMAILRTNLKELGPMDEQYFLYNEDLEWCDRAHRKGGKVGVVPTARFRHAQGSTTRKAERLPFTARLLADFQYFVESRGLPAETVRRRWRLRTWFRTWLYAVDARLKFLHLNNPESRTAIYRSLHQALKHFRWSTTPDGQSAHPSRLAELSSEGEEKR